MRVRTSGAYEPSKMMLESTGVVEKQSRFDYPPSWTWSTQESLNSLNLGGAFSNLASIADVVGSPHEFNPCTHTKSLPFDITCRLANYDLGPQCHQFGWWTTYAKDLGTIRGSFSPICLFLGDPYPVPTNLPAIDWAAMVTEVGNSLDGSMEASSNMLANFAQLGQTVSMIKHPVRLFNPRTWRTLKSARQLAKAGSSVWLEKRYGWDNFYRDIKAVANVFDEVKLHRDFLRSTEGKWVSYGASQIDTAPISASSLQDAGYIMNSFRIHPDECNYQRTAHFGTDWLRNKCIRHWSLLDLAMQRLGVNDVVVAMWDLLPFSFCVDWFINIGDLAKKDWVYWDQNRLRQMGYSVKQEWSINITIESGLSDCFGAQHLTSESFGPSVIRKEYTRSKGFPPSTSTVGLFGGLNLVHLADGAAIVAQRL